MALSEEQKQTFATTLYNLIRTRLQGQNATVPDLRDILERVRELIMEELNNRVY